MSIILPAGFKNRIDTGGLILSRKTTDSEFELGYGIGLKAKYKVQVCRHGQVIREPFGDNFIPNLIVNGGLDYCFNGTSSSTFWSSWIFYARSGTSTTAAAVTDTKLGTEFQNTPTLTGTGTSYAHDTVNGASTATYSYEFPAAGSTTTVNEVGLSWTSLTTGSSIFTHAILPSGVLLNSGDNLRLTYAFTWSIPMLITPVTVSLSAVNGFNVSGSLKMVGLFSNIFNQPPASATSTSAGNPGASNQGYFSFNQASAGSFLSAPTTFPAVNTALTETIITSSQGTSALGTYTTGSYSRTQTYTWSPSTPPSTVSNINMIRFSTTSQFGIYLLLNSAQTKANTNTLTIVLTATVSRI